MNTLPAAFEERIKKQFPEEAEKFLEALQTDSPVSIRLNLKKLKSPEGLFPEMSSFQAVEWCPCAYYLHQRPQFTLDPCLHGGAYYVQEASSMFLYYILQQIMPTGPLRVLDLCAAPGGKSTLIASLLSSDSLLIANEVIRSRASILKENVIKWGQTNVIVTNNDPADFQNLTGAFDIILVDAPCSGEGMFRKDITAIREWNENNLRLCSERQKRILSDIWTCLKPGGILIYSTCTFNREENEGILEWLTQKYQAQSIQIKHPFNTITSSDSRINGYHFYPYKIKGEGFFTGVVQKQDGQPFSFRKNKRQNQMKNIFLPDEIKPLILQAEQYSVYNLENRLGIIPSSHTEFIHCLQQTLHILYQGCEVAEINNRKFKLLPALALWQGLNKAYCPIYETDIHTALTFLKKEDIPAPPLTEEWILITYRNIGLGWCKNLGNRLNNYYPKEWRIRMQIDTSDKSDSINAK